MTTTEALAPVAAEPAIATGGAGRIVLPQVIVDAGLRRWGGSWSSSRGGSRTRGRGRRTGGPSGNFCGGARREASGSVTSRRSTSPPTSGRTPGRPHGEAAPGRDPHARRLARRQAGPPVEPAAAVRGPKHVVTKGATPVLSPGEARMLLESIDTGALAGLRDRALLSVILYSFARVSAVLGMRRQNYFGQGSRGWPRLHEKGWEAGTTSRPTTGRPRPSTRTSRRPDSRSRRWRSSRPWIRRPDG